MPLLEIPQPYDFELSTERFRAFGPDYANLWHEGGLHRVVGGREVRIEAAPGGVLVEPLDAEIEAEVGTLLGLAVRPRRASTAGRGGPTRSLGASPRGSPASGRRSRRARSRALVTSISAQQVSLFAAFAIRNRLIERFGERGEHAFSFPTRERLAAADEDELFALGFSRRKAEYVVGLARSDLDLDALGRAARRRGQGADHRRARARRVDGRLVPRAPPRPPARLARRRPRRAQGGRARSMVTSDSARRRRDASTPFRT